MKAVLGAALIAFALLSAPGDAREAARSESAPSAETMDALRARMWALAPRVQLAAVYESAPDVSGVSHGAFDFVSAALAEPRIAIEHVEAFLPNSCDAPENANDPGCRATGSVFCSAPRVAETFVSSALMVRVRSEGAARCYLVSTQHGFEAAGQPGALSVTSLDGGAACRFVRDHDLSAAPAGRGSSWAALAARPRGRRARSAWDVHGLSLPRAGATHLALPARIAGVNYASDSDDDYARVLMSEGAACEAEAAVDYTPAAPVEDPGSCEAIEWVGSFIGARRYALFDGGAAAQRLFRFGRGDFGPVRDERRRFVDHRLPSWEGVSGFAALCRRGADVTPLCIHAKGDAITRFQRQELGRSRRIIVGDDTATGNGCVAMRWIFPG